MGEQEEEEEGAEEAEMDIVDLVMPGISVLVVERWRNGTILMADALGGLHGIYIAYHRSRV